MDFADIVISVLATLGAASLTALWLAETDPTTGQKMGLDSAAIDKVILIAIIVSGGILIMRHPEWLA